MVGVISNPAAVDELVERLQDVRQRVRLGLPMASEDPEALLDEVVTTLEEVADDLRLLVAIVKENP